MLLRGLPTRPKKHVCSLGFSVAGQVPGQVPLIPGYLLLGVSCAEFMQTYIEVLGRPPHSKLWAYRAQSAVGSGHLVAVVGVGLRGGSFLSPVDPM